ncbi:hypothetical protein [Pseudomonas jilinensis]|uniref:Uncharacterized protein n=1 Tax=Pseudomonas jilinensis TaxID=2078689 RepID=A0A396RZ23_9PSED|nr:hypothetical protein [Pseudomonas jilinensis]RHW21719.1 hypothetical protein C2846_07150 [Pseudomonas jilinensis]
MAEHANPFITGMVNGRPYQSVTVEDRLAMVVRFTAAQCEAALAVPNLQKTVKTAVERRQRKLTKA